jgi:uncharacterized membrane protein YidH (DUF202 family)
VNDDVVEDEAVTGLAGERTDLAWTRSGLAIIAAVAALLRRVVDDLDLDSATSVVLAIVGAVAVAAIASIVYTLVFAGPTRHPDRPVDPVRLRRVAYGTAAFGALAVVIGLVPT